jgi:nucleoside-diphosphate-sugar epimerase
MASQTVVSDGIFHGLPTFPDHDGKTYTAIVTGANGVTGAHVVRQLASNPKRWRKIYAMSRKAPHLEHGDNVTFIPVDFLQDPKKIAEIFQKNGVTA